MAVLQMQRLSICAMKKNRKAILEELQSLGVMEIDTTASLDPDLAVMDTMESRQTFEKSAQLCDQALEILKEYAPEKTSMLSALEGKKLVDKASYEEARNHQETVLKKARKLISRRKRLTENKASVVKLETRIETLTPWLPLDVPLNYGGTEKMAMMIGSISGDVSLEQVYQRLAKDVPELEAFDIQQVSGDGDQLCIAAACLREDAARLEDALRMQGFARPSQPVRRVPEKEKEHVQAQIIHLQEENSQLEGKIKEMADSREQLRLVSDYFRARAQKYEILGHVPQSKQTFFITGYLPKKKVPALQKLLDEKYDLVAEAEDAVGDEVPVVLENGTFAGSAEGVLSSFGLPRWGEIDPSKVMAVFYVFLFGLMLSDAAYGLIVFVACAVLLKKFPRMSQGMSKSIRLFMYCGLSTLFWGILFGGYFGDLINVVSRTFFGHEVSIKPLWFAPLDDPMKLLIYSMLFGLIHLFVGLGMKGYMEIKEKKYLDFFCDVVLWYMMLTGLLIMLIPSDLFVSISQMNISFPPFVDMLGKVLAIAGAVGILLMSGRANKNPALRIALGAYDLYNITGWLSDILSYSRLLALGLATGVIASVVNQMGSMVGNSVFGVIVFILVFLVGHTFNIAINLLGAYVHTCRLQYVEFFGKFFEGGGKVFEPFKANTKYVDIKEETKI